MPGRNQRATLGFLGDGDVPEILNEKLVADQVRAARGDVHFVIAITTASEAVMGVPLRYADEHNISFEVVTDGNQKAPKAARITQAVAVPAKLVSILERADNPKLLVYWNEDDEETKQAVRRAIEAEIEVRDLCDVLTRIGKSPVPVKENHNVPSLYTAEELAAMDEDEITRVALNLGIDPNDYPEWDEVIEKILATQEEDVESAGPDQSPPPADDSEEYGSYTRDELEAMQIEELKAICKENEITVPGQRPRVPTYVKAILDFQDANGESHGEPRAAVVSGPPTTVEHAVLLNELSERVLKGFDQRFAQHATDIDTRLTAHHEAIASLVAATPAPAEPDAPAPATRPGIKRIKRP